MRRTRSHFSFGVVPAVVAGCFAWTTASAQIPSYTITTLHSFDGTNGSNPSAPLVTGPGGLLYSVVGGGGRDGDGVAYSISRTGDYDLLYTFKGGTDGASPNNLLPHDGVLYGTASGAGADGFGTAFSLTTAGKLKTLHAFTGGDGSQPGPLEFFANGGFIGAAGTGGNLPYGVVFSLTPGGALTVLYNFTNGTDESYPVGVTLGRDGNYYGTTLGDAAFGAGSGEAGTIWQLTPTGVFTTLHVFGWTDGAQPLAPPVQGTDGNLYGATATGGASGEGVVYRITPTGDYTVLYTFTGGADGGSARAGLLAGLDGNLYGSTYTGGGSGWGTLFEVTTAGVLTTLYTFTNGSDGGSVEAPLIETTSGTFFGTAETGGAHGLGTVFKFVIH